MAYFEHPNYVPLLARAYELWNSLEEITSVELFNRCGVLQIGPRNGEVFTGILNSANKHKLPIEEINSQDLTRRFPSFHVPEPMGALFEKNAGFLYVEKCIRTYAEQAQKNGAIIKTGITVTKWSSNGNYFEIETDHAKYHSKHLILTPGAWASQLLSIGIPLPVIRKPLFWYKLRKPQIANDPNAPVFLFETPTGVFYGFPSIDQLSVKLAEHTGGKKVSDPLQVSQNVDTQEKERLNQFINKHLKHLHSELIQHEVCMYTMSPDQHFIMDVHPGYSGLSFAVGLSGHGFKFTSVLGKILVDLAFNGKTAAKSDFLGLARFEKSKRRPENESR